MCGLSEEGREVCFEFFRLRPMGENWALQGTIYRTAILFRYPRLPERDGHIEPVIVDRRTTGCKSNSLGGHCPGSQVMNARGPAMCLVVPAKLTWSTGRPSRSRSCTT